MHDATSRSCVSFAEQHCSGRNNIVVGIAGNQPRESAVLFFSKYWTTMLARSFINENMYISEYNHRYWNAMKVIQPIEM